jgi:hypothetical protein
MRICIAEISPIIVRKMRFFSIPKKINALSLLAVNELAIPEKIKSA